MYDPILAKSFNSYERRRLGCSALVVCSIIAFSVCSSFDPRLYTSSLIGEAVNTKLPIHMFVAGDNNSNPTVGSSPNRFVVKSPQHEAIQIPRVECRISERGGAGYCEMEGDVRVDANCSTVFMVGPTPTNSNSSSWIIKPYPRKHISNVKNWRVMLVSMDRDAPRCTQTHTLPALLFSTGGYTGNHFHDFADLILPLFSTTFPFNTQIHFLATDYKPWWVSKFSVLLHRLTAHHIIDIETQTKHVHCYANMIVGLQFYRELVFAPSGGTHMRDFRQFLRETYSLRRRRRTRADKKKKSKPRLMIISRKRTRVVTNEAEVSRAAVKLGYEVISAEARLSTNLTKFAQLVNSCDMLMGVHGAGLTNMLFLPDRALLIQIVPFGGIDVYARLDFGNPAPAMNVKYLEYKIAINESSLSRQYPSNHPVLRDPLSFKKKGWDELKAVYLENQNVTIDIHRFKGTLAKALNLLHN
ncbi:Glycosyltransferase family 61 protein [Striga hermonthica]|uniref:Glycosyltransferase family 61 protein n=1 Tax=Striga hermonthica TaxID=68872 RepID=A0A9N7NG62_STRHE|nr:Glycosyltransferase family 61 protein [Striga hermonthica]